MGRRDRLGLTLLLGLVVALDPLSIDTALPVVPEIAGGLSSDLSSVQLGLSLFVFGMAAGQLFHGPASDRFGRRPVMLAALALYVLASAAAALAPDAAALAAARAVQGFAAAATQTVSRAIIRDRLDREDAARVLSYVLLMLGIAPIVAPALGAWLAGEVGWRAVFWAMAAYGALALAAHGARLEETNLDRDPRALDPSRLARTLAEIGRNGLFWSHVGCGAAAFAALFAFLVGSPAALIVFLGATPEEFSIWFAIVMAGNLAGYPAAARLVGRLGIDRLLTIGTAGGAAAAAALAALAFAGVHSPAAIVAPFCVYMFCFALILPAATAGALSPFPRTAGAASALLGFAQLGTAAGAGALVAAFDDGTQMPMVVVVAAAGLLGLAARGAVRAASRARL